ncbi:hypothetical protein JCM10207_001070 [Rhodosporidiobolus poonsookiae]
MADTVTLTMADEPPVFADMFALPTSSTGAQEPIRLGEKDGEIKLFLGLLAADPACDLSKATDEEWEGLARCADKYDSLLARAVVISHIPPRGCTDANYMPTEQSATAIFTAKAATQAIAIKPTRSTCGIAALPDEEPEGWLCGFHRRHLWLEACEAETEYIRSRPDFHVS